MVSSPNVTALLSDWSRSDRTALSQLLPVVYAELRRVATRQLRSERADHTLQPTALVPAVAMRVVEPRHRLGLQRLATCRTTDELGFPLGT